MKLAISDPGRFALKNAVRAAIVVPIAFWLGLKFFEQPQMALFGAFGSLGTLLFVDFGGTRRMRLLAYLGTVAGGCVTITLGTLCCHHTWLAVPVMALLGFAILFAGVIDGYIAAASLILILTFVIATMVQTDAGEIPYRLAGWGMASALSLLAIFFLWPTRPPDQLRRGGAAALDALAALLEGMATTLTTGLASAAEEERLAMLSAAAYEKVVAARNAFVSLPHRPSGAGGRTAAFGRLVDDLDWFDVLARQQPAPAAVSEGFARERAALETAVPAALRKAAERLRTNDPGDGGKELARLADDHGAIGRAFLAQLAEHRPEDDAKQVTEELNEAYRLRGLAFAALQIGRHAVQASGGEASPEPTLTQTRAGLREGRRIAGSHAGFRSVWFRNSLRAAAGLALAVLVAKVTDAQNGFWVVLGTISVLRSSALATGTTVVEAITGTGIGIIVGGVLVWAIGDHTWLLWTVFPFAVLLGAFSPRAISFTAGQAGFTIVIVILFNLLNPVGWEVGLVRIEDVAIGCAISVVVGFLFWPRGAADVLRQSIGAAYETAARYLDATIATMLGVRKAEPIEPIAMEASEAALRLDETVREYLAENGSARRDLDALARLVGGATRVRRYARLLHDASGIAPLGPLDSRAAWVAAICGPFDQAWQARRDWFEGFGAAIAAGEEPPPPEPDAPVRSEGPTSKLSRDLGPMVVLDGETDGEVPPGLAIAWAQRHLEGMLVLEPPLSEAAHAVLDDFAPRVLAEARQATVSPAPAAG